MTKIKHVTVNSKQYEPRGRNTYRVDMESGRILAMNVMTGVYDEPRHMHSSVRAAIHESAGFALEPA